jgi:hypothetical protein
MHSHSLEGVREQLLRSGIAPRTVNRYVTELRDHLTDLVTRERAAGLNPQEAETKARSILGSDAELVQAMIDRGTPRSLAARAPWAVFGFLPLLTLLVAMILLGMGTMAFFAPFGELSGAELPPYARLIGAVVSFVGSYAIGPMLAAACIAIALRQRLASRWVWVGLALIALVSGPLGVHVEFLQPEGGMTGGIQGSIAQTVQTAGRVDVNATLLLMSIRTVVLFAISVLAFRTLKQRLDNEVA